MFYFAAAKRKSKGQMLIKSRAISTKAYPQSDRISSKKQINQDLKMMRQLRLNSPTSIRRIFTINPLIDIKIIENSTQSDLGQKSQIHRKNFNNSQLLINQNTLAQDYDQAGANKSQQPLRITNVKLASVHKANEKNGHQINKDSDQFITRSEDKKMRKQNLMYNNEGQGKNVNSSDQDDSYSDQRQKNKSYIQTRDMEKMSQIEESEKEQEESLTEEQMMRITKKHSNSFQNHSSRKHKPKLSQNAIQFKQNLRKNSIVKIDSSKIASSVIRNSQASHDSKKDGSYPRNNTQIIESQNEENQEELQDQEEQQTFVVTEEEKDDIPCQIRDASSFDERRHLEKRFFENIKKDSSSGNNEMLYIVDTKWVKQWTNFLSGGENIEVSVDYYFMTEKMWKFLYAIYGGGPIMKKRFLESDQNDDSQSSSFQLINQQNHKKSELHSDDSFKNSNLVTKEQNLMLEEYLLDQEEKKFLERVSQRSGTPQIPRTRKKQDSLLGSNEGLPPGTFDIQNMRKSGGVTDETYNQANICQSAGKGGVSNFDDDVTTSRPSSSLSAMIQYNQKGAIRNRAKEKFQQEKSTFNRQHKYPEEQYPIPNNYIFREVRVVGLDNPQYFCYMNSVIQVLLSIKDFRYYFFYKEFGQVTYQTHFQKKTYCHSLAKLFKEMLTLEEEYDHLKPTFFHNLVERKFCSSLQHDAHEFLMYLLSQLQDELNPGPSCEVNRRFSTTSSQASNYWNNYLQAHPSIIDQLFVGQICQIVQCKQCQNKSPSFIPFMDISLPITQNLKTSLQQYLATERIEGTAEEMYSCLACQTKTNANIKKKFINLPRYLVLHLRRFEENEQSQFIKNKKPIDYPLEMDMDDYCNQAFEKLGKFSLIGAVLHKGKTLESGHYNCITKRLDGDWWFCNDSEIQQVQKEEHVLQSKKSVSVLIYEKQ
ncbi:ubiquitin carboxyl-terminal hydrolase family protein [Stylonychia lemnae]|uniref:Ubiquitin carboxyl-terminal hydrolase family protein n=1 Tax=Stylonychia lemnae TaxID=5949 RepID=A0A078B3I6_STYLE|nr:ubiquitin carboxyl-terminal hydrolase family protein [Stylonychia lemnae]|eukprot:CDW89095.1 ubiquitin carboxyl-terminal hydrolase family protein [Stylonychia lemnae]